MPHISQTKFCVGAATGLTNADSAPIKCTALSGTDSGSEVIPPYSVITYLRFLVTSIAGGAANIVCYLALDAAGDIPITPSMTLVIRTGKTTATSGGTGVALLVPISQPAAYDTTNRAVYVIAKTDAGTVTATPYVHFRRG